MKRILLVVLAPLFLLTGCGATLWLGAVPMERLELVRAVAVDRTDGGILLTVSTAATEKGDSPRVCAMTGDTLAQALYRLQTSTLGQETYFAHTEYVLVGPSATGELAGILDFLARSGQIRSGVKLVPVRGGSAGELVTACAGEGTSLPNRLDVLADTLRRRGEGAFSAAGEVTAAFSEGRACAVLAVKPVPSGDESPDAPDVVPEPAGYVLADEQGVLGCLTGEAAFGAAILLGQLEFTQLTVQAEGSAAAVGITRAAVSLHPSQENGALSLTLSVAVSADLRQLEGPGDPRSEDFRHDLETAVSDRIAARVRQAVAVTQALGRDALGLGKLWEREGIFSREIPADWERTFPGLEIAVTAETVLERTFDSLVGSG